MYSERWSRCIVCKGFRVGFGRECVELLYEVGWMMVLGLILIIGELWFGINGSKLKGIGIRKWKGGRRSFNKIIDYIC